VGCVCITVSASFSDNSDNINLPLIFSAFASPSFPAIYFNLLSAAEAYTTSFRVVFERRNTDRARVSTWKHPHVINARWVFFFFFLCYLCVVVFVINILRYFIIDLILGCMCIRSYMLCYTLSQPHTRIHIHTHTLATPHSPQTRPFLYASPLYPFSPSLSLSSFFFSSMVF
jgi:hypothetical protein